MDEKKYNQIAEELKPKKQVFKNTIYAFLFGGVIGTIGEFFLELYQDLFSISEKDAGPIMIITLVLIAAILTGLGIYDRLGNIAGAGTFIPITGFSNAMTSCALDAKTEGLVTGVAANIFKLGGAVITFGIVASFVLGGLRYVFSFFI
ncbi:MAG: stage V sporulation protein AC [Faecalibacillus sp.]